jgi:hypothetical protein
LTLRLVGGIVDNEVVDVVVGDNVGHMLGAFLLTRVLGQGFLLGIYNFFIVRDVLYL